MSKVCVIGLDGGTFNVIDYLIGQNRLPNIARLMAEGSRADLMSTVPPLTWPAWASFYTGTNPGKTGAADLFKFRPGTYQLEPMNAGNLHGTPFWSLAGSQGLRTCVFNVPVTYPAIPVNGILISGLDAPRFDDRAIYPAEQKNSLLEAVPDFSITFVNDAKYIVNNFKDPVKEQVRRLDEYLDMEIRAINYLMQREDWDLFMTVIRSTDIFQHTFWRDVEKVITGEAVSGEEQRRAEAVFNCYETIDTEFGNSWSAWCSDKDLIIMSDHGFGLLRGYVCMNRVLADAGLLKFRPASGRKRSRDFMVSKLQARLPSKTRQGIKKILGKSQSGERWRMYVDVLVADIDWSQTQICSIGGFGSLFVNMKGRDPMGTVASEDEREAVLDKAEEALSKLRDPRDGQPLLTRCHRKEEHYHGPLMSEIPDMVVDMRDWSYCPVIGTASELAEEAIVREPLKEWKQLAHTGTHRREGILVMHGRDVASADLAPAQMVDVAPTIMNMLGLPSPPVFDGRVLKEALVGGKARPVAADKIGAEADKAGNGQRGQAYSESDEEEIRKRLSDLGYL